MNEHERRYRSSIGKSSSEQARARYKAAAQGRSARPAANSKKPMTYDDFLAESSDTEKIIELNEDSKVERFLDFSERYFGWLKAKRDKYTPIVKEKVKTGAKTAVKKQPVTKDRLKKGVKQADGWLDPLKQKYGRQNVHYGMITGTVVLVLLGGFILVWGGGADSDVATGDSSVQETGFGEVQGAETPTQPDFEVATPSDNTQQTAIRFDPEQGVASFQDKLREHTFTISQQPLTDTQLADKEGQLEIIAVNLLAEVSFETQFGTTYLTNTAPDGTSSQVAMFMTDELLVFIRTGGTSLSADNWVEYINTIQS